MTVFTLAHLSDPHLTGLDGVGAGHLANKRALGYLSWQRRRRHVHRREVLDALTADIKAQKPDHVAVTGDLTHIGLPREFRDAARWLEELGDPASTTVIPGNHDAYVAAPWEETCALWQAYLSSDDGPGRSADMFPSVRRRRTVALIGVSTAVPSAPFLATGRVGRTQLERLESALTQLARERAFRVVLIHHCPVPGAERWRKRLTDAAEVAAALKRSGAELVLHGHGHRPLWHELSTAAGRLPVVSVPSASASDEHEDRLAAYNLYFIRASREGWHLRIRRRRYDRASGDVIEIPGRELALARDYE